MSEEPDRAAVNYLRFLLDSGLSEDEIVGIAKEQAPSLEVCFNEETCLLMSKTLERGKYLVLIG